MPRNMIFDRVWIHGNNPLDYGTRRDLEAHGRNITIKNSHVDSIPSDGDGIDATGIWGNDYENLVIDNNFVSASTLNILTAGTESRETGTTPKWLTITSNFFTRHPSYWR
jgi:hypothetical protein